MKVRGLGLQEAVDRVGNMCCDVLDTFRKDRERLPKWSPDTDTDVERYIRGLESWLIACLHWSFMSGRYFGAKGLQIKETRVVELIPTRQIVKNSQS